jgi:magnesium-transporting ATPase (P-type)
METGLQLIGCTATEDKLQDGVPEAIQSLRRAGIHVWMITGDKLGTAIEIAKSCRLFGDDSREKRFVIDSPSKEGAVSVMREALAAPSVDALVVSGRSLDFLLDRKYVGIRDEFRSLAMRCHSVVACRATKDQKAQIVQLVKEGLQSHVLTLAIGDGANDVPMIKKAHIGIGIYGKEGRQAVQNSDYALPQFAHLERLLLFHGRLFYLRIAKTVLYFFFKNVHFSFCQFLYQVCCYIFSTRFE